MLNIQILKTVQGKFIVLFFIFLFLGILNLVASFTGNTEKIGGAINIAGRQRMLSQKITKEILLFSKQRTKENLQKLIGTSHLFDESLKGLLGSKKKSKIPFINDIEIQKQLNHIAKLWDTFYSNIKQITSVDINQLANIDDVITYIIKNNLVLLVESNKAVKLYEKKAKKDVRTLKTITSVIVLLIVIVIVLSLTFFVLPVFKKIKREIILAVGKIATISETLEKDNNELSKRTSDQAASLEETAATVEEITSTIKQTADSSSEASTLSRNTNELARSGQELFDEVKSSMDEISDSSNKISSIISLVEEIAFQTNILAINAAIEAAKAGDHGKGFAVVAIEVRDLAQRSAEAAKDIKGLIVLSTEKVEKGSGLVKETDRKLNAIREQVQKVTDLVGEISSAAGEQHHAVSQINLAVTQLDNVTQENAGLVDEVNSHSKIIAKNTVEMKEIIQRNFGQ